MGERCSWKSLMDKQSWPDLERLFEGDPTLVEVFADEWVQDALGSIYSPAQGQMRTRREARSAASLTMWLLSGVATQEGYPHVAEALQLARFRV